jgi:inosine-uridine nucleoside N-ribohydrolase
MIYLISCEDFINSNAKLYLKGIGNITPVAEFNILIDPEAAKIVFESQVKIVQIPLEVSLHNIMI